MHLIGVEQQVSDERIACDVEVGVIYTYERHFIVPLLESLAASNDVVSRRLLLVDNASEDGVDEFAAMLPGTHVLRNEKRLGYGANLSRILEASSSRYVLLMNTDMLFEPGEQCITKMVRFMDSQPDCGLAGCRLYHPDGTYLSPARRLPSIRSILARRLDPFGLLRSAGASHLYTERHPHESFECDWLSGCFLMVRREAFQDVGSFDPRFRKYFEDVDYCQRIAQSGWKVLFHGGTFAYHLEQRASRRLWSRDAALHIESYLKWLAKNTGRRPVIRRVDRRSITPVGSRSRAA